MRFVKNAGTNLTQYAIALALVAVALVPAYLAFGMQIQDCLAGMFNIQSGINNQMKINSILTSANFNPASLQPGDLGGTYQNPVQVCVAGECIIDYGDIILTGIPADFGEFIETAGAPGGTNKVLSLLDQLALQLDSTNPNEANAIRDLIQLGNQIVQVEQRFENNKDNIIASNSQYEAYFNALNQVTSLEEYNLLNSQYQDLIQMTESMFQQRDALDITNINDLTIDFYNLANALHPEGVVFYNQNGGVCLPPPAPPCDPLDPNHHYFRDISPTGSYEDYINGTNPINPIHNNANYPEYINPLEMPNSTNTPVGNYYLTLKTLLESGGLDNNPAAKEVLNVLSKEIYEMANDLVNVTQGVSSATLLPPNPDPFSIDAYTQHFSGNPQPDLTSPMQLLYQDINNSQQFERPELNASLICTGDRANNPQYQGTCTN